MATSSKATQYTDDVIAADAIVSAPRGRKKDLNQDLINLLKKVDATHGVALGATFGSVTDAKAKQSVAATIRKHWAEIHGEDDAKSKIAFHPVTGIPQVKMRD